MLAIAENTLESIPAGLRALPQWVCWRKVLRAGDTKPTKQPFHPSGRHASHADPTTWSTFDAACAAASRFDGVGFVFTANDPYCGIDLDACYTPDGTLKAWAVEIVSAAQEAECYIERTPSGLGLHIIGRATFGAGRKVSHAAGAVECYDRVRYFTVTGEQTSIGDCDGDLSAVVGILQRQFFAKKGDTVEVDLGSTIPDYEADQLAAACLAGASTEFLSYWHDKVDVTKHGGDRSAHRMSLLNRIAMKLGTHLGRQPTAAEVKQTALRAPFIRHECSTLRGKWPRLAQQESTAAIAFAMQHSLPMPSKPAALPGSDLFPVEFLDELDQRAPVEWLIRKWLQTRGLSVVYGKPGSGKSFLVLDMAMTIARAATMPGVRWQNERVKGGGVLYIAAEGNMQLRVRAWKQQRGLTGDLPIGFVHAPIDLASLGTADVQRMARTVHAHAERLMPLRAVIIDTLARAMPGADENSGEAMGMLIHHAEKIADELACAVVLVHHVGKDESRGMRGHSSLLGALTTAIEVARDDGAPARTASVIKQKDGEDGQSFGFTLQSVDLGPSSDPDADPDERDTSCVIVPDVQVGPSIGRKGSARADLLLSVIGGRCSIFAARTAFYAACGIDDADKRRVAWNRAFNDLKNANRIAIDSGEIWVIDPTQGG